MFQNCFGCGRRGQVLQSHPLPISPLLQTPDWWPVSPQRFGSDSASHKFRCDNVCFPGAHKTHSTHESQRFGVTRSSVKLPSFRHFRDQFLPTHSRGPKTHPKARNTRNTAFTRTFSKARVNFCLLPCDRSQEPNGNSAEELVQTNSFILGGFFRVDVPQRKKTKGQQLKGKIVSALFHIFRTFPHCFTLFRNFSPRTFLTIKAFLKDKKKKETKPFCTLVVARWSSSDFLL